MPKDGKSTKDKVLNFSAEFEHEHISTDNTKLVLLCTVCGTSVGVKRSSVLQHISTEKHQKNKRLNGHIRGNLKFGFITNSIENQAKSFNTELCEALIKADIPLYKLNNPAFKGFLEKYTARVIPEASTIRKSQVEPAYLNAVNKIRTEIGNGPIWISVDETTDKNGRYIANVIVGKLDGNPGKGYLLHCTELEKTNSSTIARTLTEALEILWPGKILYESVFLLVTDAAPYMKKAYDALKVLYPRMVHVTCVAHALHRVAETIRAQFPKVNSFISSMKAAFKKAPSRINTFKELCPNLPLPPSPITTRWGTWLQAADYYAQHFKNILRVLTELEDDSEAVKEAKKLAKDKQLFANLIEIKSH